jgi:hypothetical protein
MKTGPTTDRASPEQSRHITAGRSEQMSRHIGVGFRKGNTGISFFPGKTQGTASTFHDSKVSKLTKGKETSSKTQFITTFHSTNVEDMRRIEARLENDHRKLIGAKNIYCPPSDHCFREELSPDQYGRQPFQVFFG